MENLIIFGAGASKGSDKQNTPPIGENLFTELQKCDPNGWGKISSDLNDVFKNDFEEGMRCLADRSPEDISYFQIEMAKFFFNFEPNIGNNLYLKLGERIKKNQLSVALISLNYDKLLQLCIKHTRLTPIINRNPIKNQEIEICYPHGSSFLFCTQRIKTRQEMIREKKIKLVNTITKGKFTIILDPKKFYQRFETDPVPPIISYINPEKSTTACVNFINEQRNRYSQLVKKAKTIVIIGVKVRIHDTHLWDPLEKTNARIIYCSGKESAKEFHEWYNEKRLNKKNKILKRYFEEEFEKICQELVLD